MKPTTRLKLENVIRRLIKEENFLNDFVTAMKEQPGIKTIYDTTSNTVSISGNTSIKQIEKMLSKFDIDAWVEKSGNGFVVDFKRRNRNSEDNAPPYSMGSELSAPTGR